MGVTESREQPLVEAEERGAVAQRIAGLREAGHPRGLREVGGGAWRDRGWGGVLRLRRPARKPRWATCGTHLTHSPFVACPSLLAVAAVADGAWAAQVLRTFDWNLGMLTMSEIRGLLREG